MKTTAMSNFSGMKMLLKDELKNIFGGVKEAEIRCNLSDGSTVDCESDDVVTCIDNLIEAGHDVTGCYNTKPVPDEPVPD